jgi:hypothetical protein
MLKAEVDKSKAVFKLQFKGNPAAVTEETAILVDQTIRELSKATNVPGHVYKYAILKALENCTKQ